jgi:hypothetical protein
VSDRSTTSERTGSLTQGPRASLTMDVASRGPCPHLLGPPAGAGSCYRIHGKSFFEDGPEHLAAGRMRTRTSIDLSRSTNPTLRSMRRSALSPPDTPSWSSIASSRASGRLSAG